MIDIRFYMKVYELKKKLMNLEHLDKEYVFREFETMRSTDPVIYNIETTNACNMQCKMCPRTTLMTRKIETLDMDLFKRIINQIRPWAKDEWDRWQDFAEKDYKIPRKGMSENHFFLYIIPKVIVLHGYGDPLLDKDMTKRVKLMSDRGIPTYFSCNPANIDVKKTIDIFKAGLNYVKYSIDSVEDETHKKIRGPASNFSESYNKILKILEIKEKEGLKTNIVITMINFDRLNQQEEYQKLVEKFKDFDVYIYLKSLDQLWYEKSKQETMSIHWSELCQFPWSSMSIKSDGKIAMCSEDFNNEIILGDSKEQTLLDIWNGEKYIQFRKNHFELKPGLKCTERCDMKLAGSYFVPKK
ncbi:MAG: radical SAM/SPASM domain-containing protein [archaeon]